MIALAYVRDQSHARAVEIERAQRGRFQLWVTTELFLAETHAFILKRADRRAADQTLRSVLSSPRFDVVFGNEQAYRAAMELLASRPDIRLSYADAHGLACARERGIDTAFTLDRAWAAFGFTILD